MIGIVRKLANFVTVIGQTRAAAAENNKIGSSTGKVKKVTRINKQVVREAIGAKTSLL